MDGGKIDRSRVTLSDETDRIYWCELRCDVANMQKAIETLGGATCSRGVAT